jgi:hypothetical protein
MRTTVSRVRVAKNRGRSVWSSSKVAMVFSLPQSER